MEEQVFIDDEDLEPQQLQLEEAEFPYTFEEHMLVRLPKRIALLINEHKDHLSKLLKVSFKDDRHATVTVLEADEVLPAVLLDMPTIVESHRALNSSTNDAQGVLCKVADIHQLLHVFDGPLSDPLINAQLVAFEENNFQRLDGLTPPMRNVRERRFKPAALMAGAAPSAPLHSLEHQKDMEKIEKQVKMLLDKDVKAKNSSFQLIDANGKVLATGTVGEARSEEQFYDGDDLEGEADEGEEDGEGLMEGEGEGEEDEMFAAELEEAMLADDTQTEIEVIETVSVEARVVMSPAVVELHQKIAERRAQLANVTNPLIRARLEDVIRQLEDDLSSRRI